MASASVDVGTGNVDFSTTLLQLPGIGANAPIGLSFNSLDTTSGTGAGASMESPHWTWSLAGAGTLSLQSDGSTIDYTAGDGAVYPFTLAGSLYVAPAGLKASLVKNSDGSYKLFFLQSMQSVNFTASGAPTSIVDKNGNSTAVSIASATAANVTSTAGPSAARTATLAYTTGSPNKVTVTQAQGTSSARSAVVSENSSHQITKIVDPSGDELDFTYNSAGLVSKITNDIGATTTIAYDSSNRATSVAQSNTTSGSAGTSTTRLTYPSSTQTLAAGPDTSQSTAVASVPHATFTIGSNALVSAETDAAGRQHQTTFTTQGLDVASTTAGATGSGGTAAISTTYGYSSSVNGGLSLTSATAQSGNESTASYGATSAPYSPSSTTADANTSAGSMITNYTYDGFGNQLTSSGNTQMGDASSTDSTSATSTLTYNSDGTVATATAPGNGTNDTVYGYNSNHQLISVTPVSGSSLGTRSYTYDGLGRLSTATDGAGNTTTYSYDNDDRLAGVAYSDGTTSVTFGHNGDGTVGKIDSASGEISNRFDQLGQLRSTSNNYNQAQASYTYDAAGNTTSVTNNAGTTTYGYDAAGGLLSEQYPTASGTAMVYFALNSNGQRTDTWFDSSADHSSWDAHEHVNYDASGRVGEVIGQVGPASSATTKVDLLYCYNTTNSGASCGSGTSGDSSKVQSIYNQLTGQSTVLTYDGMGRLISYAQSGGSGANNTYTYTYDARGNRLTATVTGSNPSSQTLTYNAANQITTSGYSYDGAGNLTASPGATYAYNAAGQMTTTTVGGTQTSYTYAGLGQSELLEAESSSSDLQYAYGRSDTTGVPELTSYRTSSTLQDDIFCDPVTGQPSLLQDSAAVTTGLYMYDGIGNPIALLDNSTDMQLSATYDPYGVANVTRASQPTAILQTPYGLKDGIQDQATGLIRFDARWYNSITGNWTQQDTLDAPLDLANANRYDYAGDDPINNSDPDGNRFLGIPGCIAEVEAGGGVIVGGVAGASADVLISTVAAPETGGASLIVGAAQAVEDAALIAIGTYLVLNGAECK